MFISCICIFYYLFLIIGATAAPRSYFGVGSGPIHLDNVGCSGSENEISQCAHAGFRKHNCQHVEDASVFCQGNR